MSELEAALEEAVAFVQPVWKAGSEDLIDRLNSRSKATESFNYPERVKSVLRKALGLFLRIHHLDVDSGGADKYDSESRQACYALLDLIAVRCILPSLSEGFLLAHRPKSVVPALNESADKEHPAQREDFALLCEVIDGFVDILQKPGAGLAPLIRERALVDVFAGAADLAFAVDRDQDTNIRYQKLFTNLIDVTPTFSLLPVLTQLVQPTTPEWLRPYFRTPLSLIPLRERGVRQTIEWIAAMQPDAIPEPDHDHNHHDPDSRGVALSLESLQQASAILSSVPQSMDPDLYFTGIGPQLLNMLDGNDGPDLVKAASLVIGSILMKKAYGMTDKVGWKLFADPVLRCFSPPASDMETTSPRDAHLGTIVAEEKLKLALKRLSALVTSHPNPPLTKRMLGGLMLPLWTLLTYAKSKPVDKIWKKNTWQLLETWAKFCAGPPQLETLAENLLADGPPAWSHGPGSEGGIEIRRRAQTGAPDIFEQIQQVEQRTATYQDLLASGAVDDQEIGELFVKLTKKWLSPRESPAGRAPRLQLTPELDPIPSLVNTKLVFGMLEKSQNKLASNPAMMTELVKQLLVEWAEKENIRVKRDEDLRNATFAGLSNIVKHDDDHSDDKSTLQEEDRSAEVVPIALSVLGYVISAKTFKPSPPVVAILKETLPYLRRLNNPQMQHLGPSTPANAQNLINKISLYIDAHTPERSPHRPVPSTTATKNNTSDNEDQQTLTTALADLTDPQPPIRASGLAALTTLTTHASSAIDVPALTLQLTRNALTDPDDYVYLHAVRALVALAERDPRIAGTLLVDAFIDPHEEAVGREAGLDGRIRVGEVLSGAVTALREGRVARAWGAETARALARTVADGAVMVAGRRGKREKALAARGERARAEREKRGREEREFGTNLPDLDELTATGEQMDETEIEERNVLRRIVEGWEDTGLEEDVRLRSSALSILGELLEVPDVVALLDQSTLLAAADLATSALTLEAGDDRAILRRAAAMLIMSLVRAMDAAHEAGGKLAVNLPAQKWEDVEKVMGWVRDVDEDPVTKGHAAAVVEGIDAWRTKSALGVKADGTVIGDFGKKLDLGEGRLRGLDVDPGAGLKKSGGRMAIEEIDD